MTHIAPEFVYPAAALLCAVVGGIFDVKSRRVPNLLTGPSILFGLVLHLVLGGWHELLLSGLAGLVCGAVFLIFFMAGGMGGGDVKLIAAVGCIAGWHSVASLLVITALAGGVMAIGLAVARGRLKETLFNVATIANHHREQGLTPHPEIHVRNANTLRLPYALAIAAGCAVTLYMQGVQR